MPPTEAGYASFISPGLKKIIIIVIINTKIVAAAILKVDIIKLPTINIEKRATTLNSFHGFSNFGGGGGGVL